MLGFRPTLQASPWPYDAVITVASKRYGLMLQAQPYDLVSKKEDDTQATSPTEYGSSGRNPFIEGTRRFLHWVEGAGTRFRTKDATHSYYMADGVDCSIGGVAILGPDSTTVTPTVTGGLVAAAIKQIVEMAAPESGTLHRRLYALAGNQVWKNVGSPSTGADWVFSKDFSTAIATPNMPTVTSSNLATPVLTTPVASTGTDDGAVWTYRVQAKDASGNTISTASVARSTNHGATAIVTATDYNALSWAAVTGAATYDVYLTAVPAASTINGVAATTGFLANVAVAAYQHDTANGGLPASPPAAQKGIRTYQYRLVGIGGANPPASVRSSQSMGTTDGPDTLSATLFNTITWVDNGATNYEVWRTTVTGGSPSTTGKIGVVAAGVQTFTDTGLGVIGTPGTGPTAAVVQTPTSMMPYFYATTNYLYVGVDVGAYWRFDGTTWTQGAVNTDFGDSPIGSVFGQAGRYFFRGINASATGGGNLIYRTPADPFGTTSDPNGVTGWMRFGGDSGQFPYTSIQFVNDQLVSFETGRVGVGNVLSDISPFVADPDVDNGRTSIVWNGAVYARYGSSFLKIVPSSFTDAVVDSVGPERMVENVSAINGYVTAAVGHNNWFLYFTLYNPVTGVTYLGKIGSWLTPEETNSARWEFAPHLHLSIAKWTGRKAGCMFISNISATDTTSNPCLFIGMDNGSFRRIILPANSPNPVSDAACRYNTGACTLDLPIDDAGYAGFQKVYRRATVLVGASASGTTILYYALDRSASYTQISGAFGDTGLDRNFAAGVSGRTIQPRLYMEIVDADKTPQVQEIQIHATVRGPMDASGNPGFIRQRRMVVQCMDGIIRRDGHPEAIYTGQQIRDVLQTATAAGDVALVTRDGVSRTVSITNAEEGLVIGRNGERTTIVTLDYVEQSLAT